MGRGASKIVLFTEGRSPEVNSRPTILEAPLPIVLTRNSQGKVYLYIIIIGGKLCEVAYTIPLLPSF